MDTYHQLPLSVAIRLAQDPASSFLESWSTRIGWSAQDTIHQPVGPLQHSNSPSHRLASEATGPGFSALILHCPFALIHSLLINCAQSLPFVVVCNSTSASEL